MSCETRLNIIGIIIYTHRKEEGQHGKEEGSMGRRKVSFDFLLLAFTSVHTQEGGGAAWKGGGQYGKEKSQF